MGADKLHERFILLVNTQNNILYFFGRGKAVIFDLFKVQIIYGFAHTVQ